jgi:hypothetical protein
MKPALAVRRASIAARVLGANFSYLRSSLLVLATVAVCAMGASHQVHATQFIVNGSFEANSFNRGSAGLALRPVKNDVIPASDGFYPWGIQNGAFGAGPKL